MMNFLNLTLSEKHFICPSSLNDSFAGYSNLGCRSLSLILGNVMMMCFGVFLLGSSFHWMVDILDPVFPDVSLGSTTMLVHNRCSMTFSKWVYEWMSECHYAQKCTMTHTHSGMTESEGESGLAEVGMGKEEHFSPRNCTCKVSESPRPWSSWVRRWCEIQRHGRILCSVQLVIDQAKSSDPACVISTWVSRHGEALSVFILCW